VSAAPGGAGSPPHAPEFQLLSREDGIVAACFTAMASPCELLLEAPGERQAAELGREAAQEAWRIERKLSRYRPDSIVSVINRSDGHTVVVDQETAALLDYAAQCHALSEGRFDITSGVLRRCWTFDGSDRLPEPTAVSALLPLVGFEKIRWQPPRITLPAGMEIDFGGFGKEYAARLLLELSQGALATSGDTRRFLLRDGVRYSHILDVRTGWPVANVPRSVTVAGGTCVEAGMLATFAMLRGRDAEAFLDGQGVRYWSLR
jgi:thiamine biosynthesis lipoprotein